MRVAAGFAVVAALAFPAKAPAEMTGERVRFWLRVATCETGRDWQAAGPTYEGGLGFYWRTWDWWAGELGLERRYPSAGSAPWRIQVRVADYGWRRHRGWWGCFAHTGRPA